jgi:protein SCO1/2
MTRIFLGTLMLLGACAATQAAFSKAQLGAAYADPKPNAQLPLAQEFTDEGGKPLTLGGAIDGKPAVVVFADYTCTTLCGPILAFAAGGLEKTGLVAGRDFHLIAIGIDPKDSLADAKAMKDSHIGTGTVLAKNTVMLTGNAGAIRAVTAAAGYHYVYDKTVDQFAHPAIAYVVTAKGRISRVLSGLGLDAGDLRLALVDAGHGRVGTFADRIRLLCYCFDPATGIYSAVISRVMLGAGVVTVLIMAGGILLLIFGVRRRQQT